MEADPPECELCGRRVAGLTRHHLIPRTRHGRRPGRSAEDRRAQRERIARLCAPCHKQVHALLSEKELEREFDTVTKLAAHPELARFVRWIRTKPDGTHVATRRPKGRRGRRGPR